jgi:hypothetical protein
MPSGLSVAEDTFFPQQYFLTNFTIIINSAFVFMGVVNSLSAMDGRDRPLKN